MNVRNAVINGNKKKNKGGPRTVHVDNSFPAMKLALRRWIVDKFENPTVLDVYGGYGKMYQQLWYKYSYTATKGDALQWLSAQESLNFDIYDVDPYSSPYEALNIINKKAIKNRIGIICTDGCLRRQAQMRGNFPEIIQALCGWPAKNNHLMASLYYNYPKYLKFIIYKVMDRWEILNMAVKYGKGWGKSSTVYFAAILEKR